MGRETIRDSFLEAPPTQIDEVVLEVIRRWDPDPTPLQLLEAIDEAIFFGAASGFAVAAMQVLLDTKLIEQGLTHEDIVKEAAWRNR